MHVSHYFYIFLSYLFFGGGGVGRQLRVIAVLGKLKGVIWHGENNECAKVC